VNFAFLDQWEEFLPREAGHVISLMGSGGKTSLMRILAERYAAWGIPAVLTTTTRSEPLMGIPGFTLEELPEPSLLPEILFLHAGLDPQGKWLGLDPAAVDDLGHRFPDRIILAEVDGSAKKPIKLHHEDEPRWPSRTSLALVVMGTAAVGSPAGRTLHRFGQVFWSPLAGLNEWTVWEWKHQLTLLLGPGGYLDRVPADVPAVLALTGLDEEQDSIGLFGFAGEAMEDQRLPLVMFCALGEEKPMIRTAWRDDGDSP